jgi:hypothetical protein
MQVPIDHSSRLRPELLSLKAGASRFPWSRLCRAARIKIPTYGFGIEKGTSMALAAAGPALCPSHAATCGTCLGPYFHSPTPLTIAKVARNGPRCR